MNFSKKDLEEMKDDELKQLIEQAQLILRERDSKKKKVFEFEFKATALGRRKKSFPYVAKLILKFENGRKKLERQFYQFDRYYDSLEVTVEGKYIAHVGDIIEKREGGNWSEDIRSIYIVDENGREIEIENDKRKIMKYLEGKISKEELIRDSWVKEVK